MSLPPTYDALYPRWLPSFFNMSSDQLKRDYQEVTQNSRGLLRAIVLDCSLGAHEDWFWAQRPGLYEQMKYSTSQPRNASWERQHPGVIPFGTQGHLVTTRPKETIDAPQRSEVYPEVHWRSGGGWDIRIPPPPPTSPKKEWYPLEKDPICRVFEYLDLGEWGRLDHVHCGPLIECENPSCRWGADRMKSIVWHYHGQHTCSDACRQASRRTVR